MNGFTASLVRLWQGPQPVAPDIAREVLRSLWPATRRESLVSGTFGITVLWVIFWVFRSDVGALVWAGVAYLAQAVRWFQIRAMPLDAMLRAPIDEINRRTALPALMFSGVWALPPWMFYPADDMAFVALMCFFIMGLVQAGAAGVAFHWPVLRAFLLPPTLSLALCLFIDGRWLAVVLGLDILVLLLVLIRFAWTQNTLVTQSIVNRVENERLADQQQQRLGEIERLSGEKTRLFAAANHDLRQPLHSLSLFSAALAGEVRDPGMRDKLAHMQRAIASLETSFNLMLDISRLDSGTATPQPAPVSLASIFRALNERFADQARHKQLALRFAPTDGWVTGDPVMLDRLLGNLVENAIKYTLAGAIWIGARRRAGGQQWLVEVRDSGIGIAPDLQARVFEEFFQVDNANRDRNHGLGLGLSIVQRLARTLGYTLTLRSAPGRGSTFSLLMPACPPAAVAPASTGRDTQDGAPPLGLRVIVLDDEASVRDGMTVLLQGWGCAVTTAATHDELQQYFNARSDDGAAMPWFDVLVADLRLPGPQDGLEIARAVLDRGAVARVLMLTGETTPATLARVQESGLPFALKPVDPDRLRDLLAGAPRQ
ncbi:hybrid sensor histidine kinase/response regulator [Reyranella sp. CPCC 100927]|uniref:ATP-binding response regulator n=1 Tax=Reyranella sp. CPCC 100927 TaxID=2599616 RepID=UPI0011B78CC6|nr:hybrid sensor histidine kinase/response regulator [Reyranella sp. CPCC 100927]TWT13724.1 hybrid sensor histidine kinase/response regulator [Reyranella sp. CPCC 100927]